ncbi:hypothetical protein ES705_49140 [subsurface metagenome]
MKTLNLDKLVQLTKELAPKTKGVNNPGTKGYTSQDIKIAEWRGGVTEALTNLKDGQDKIEEKVDKLNSRLTAVRIRVAAIGGASGLVVSAIAYIILKTIFG